MRRLEEIIFTLSAGIGGKNERPVLPVDSSTAPALGSTADASDIDNGGELVNHTSRKDQLAGGLVPGRRDVVSEGRYLGYWDTARSATEETADKTNGLRCPSVNSLPFLNGKQSRAVELDSPETHNVLLFGPQPTAYPFPFVGPNPSQQRLLWQSYLENVAPLVTIVHRPSLEQLLAQASRSEYVIDKPSKALLFAVYLSAITSMTSAQCLDKLGEQQEELICRYRFAVEQALTQADFINSHSLNLLQSAVLYLICIRRHDKQNFVWTMIAVVLRLAQRLELHRESALSVKSPIDIEMSRRLWWHISILDVQCAEDYRTEPMIHDGQYDTRFPLNINDNDLTPGATEFPSERLGFTDMTFSLIRFQITATYRVLKRSLTVQSNISAEDIVIYRQQLVADLERRLYENYLQYCNTAITVHWLCSTISRLVLSKLRLYVYDAVTLGDMPTTEPMAKVHEFLFATSVDIIELSVLLETSKRDPGNWSWVFKNNNQWNALAFVLAELCVRSPGPDVDRAWLAVTSAYNSWNSQDTQAQKEIWPVISRLMVRATDAKRRQLGLSCGDGSILTRQYCRPFPVVGPRPSGRIDDLRQPLPRWSQVLPHNSEPSLAPNHSYNMLNDLSLPVNGLAGVPELGSGVDNRFSDLLEDDLFSSIDFPPNPILDLF
ncbi:hypothetical protein CNMCM7691_000065 [Aspergillus felis]|uniref:Xylanolytic transcriptional activator regulatory domain-containing protein n=1 Tax=Aspergillus felis TaxID=1287682 RepID=A0A8H6QZW9_9EURO|nr:hypothetical protein CNMCM7691_000065 [Aspergillus felis]